MELPKHLDNACKYKWDTTTQAWKKLTLNHICGQKKDHQGPHVCFICGTDTVTHTGDGSD